MKKQLLHQAYEVETPSGSKYHLTLDHTQSTYDLFTHDHRKIAVAGLTPNEIGYIKEIVEFALRELGLLPPHPEAAPICSNCRDSF
jgi:hypothetical protein